MTESQNRSRADLEIAQRKIFVGGLSYSTDDEKLRKYFSTYGSIQDAVVMKDPVTRRSRGFGFITFVDISSVDGVLENEPHSIDARKVEAKRAVPRADSALSAAKAPAAATATATATAKPSSSSTNTASPASGTAGSSSHSHSNSNSASATHSKAEGESRPEHKNSNDYAYNKIFVGGLHYDTRDAEFKAYFEKYGKVVQSEVMFNRETHKSRGFGFIVFEQERGAELVCADAEHIIDGKEVEVKRAIPRSKIGHSSESAVVPSASSTPPHASAAKTSVEVKKAAVAPVASALPVPAPTAGPVVGSSEVDSKRPVGKAPSAAPKAASAARTPTFSYAAALKASTVVVTAAPAPAPAKATVAAATADDDAASDNDSPVLKSKVDAKLVPVRAAAPTATPAPVSSTPSASASPLLSSKPSPSTASRVAPSSFAPSAALPLSFSSVVAGGSTATATPSASASKAAASIQPEVKETKESGESRVTASPAISQVQFSDLADPASDLLTIPLSQLQSSQFSLSSPSDQEVPISAIGNSPRVIGAVSRSTGSTPASRSGSFGGSFGSVGVTAAASQPGHLLLPESQSNANANANASAGANSLGDLAWLSASAPAPGLSEAATTQLPPVPAARQQQQQQQPQQQEQYYSAQGPWVDGNGNFNGRGQSHQQPMMYNSPMSPYSVPPFMQPMYPPHPHYGDFGHQMRQPHPGFEQYPAYPPYYPQQHFGNGQLDPNGFMGYPPHMQYPGQMQGGSFGHGFPMPQQGFYGYSGYGFPNPEPQFMPPMPQPKDVAAVDTSAPPSTTPAPITEPNSSEAPSQQAAAPQAAPGAPANAAPTDDFFAFKDLRLDSQEFNPSDPYSWAPTRR